MNKNIDTDRYSEFLSRINSLKEVAKKTIELQIDNYLEVLKQKGLNSQDINKKINKYISEEMDKDIQKIITRVISSHIKEYEHAMRKWIKDNNK